MQTKKRIIIIATYITAIDGTSISVYFLNFVLL